MSFSSSSAPCLNTSDIMISIIPKLIEMGSPIIISSERAGQKYLVIINAIPITVEVAAGIAIERIPRLRSSLDLA